MIALTVAIIVLGVFIVFAVALFGQDIVDAVVRLVHILETANANLVQLMDERDKVKLSDETAAKLRQYAVRQILNSKEDPAQSYVAGLQDGVTMTAQFVLDELKEETE